MERESAFGMGLRTWARWVDRYVDRTKTTVFFRSLSPQHSGQHYCYNQSQPILDEFLLPPFPNSMARIVEGRIRRMRTPVRYLNITKLSQYRKDAHPSIYSSKREKLMINQKQSPDCSHWCLPGLPDTWTMLLYVSMVSSNSSSWHLMVWLLLHWVIDFWNAFVLDNKIENKKFILSLGFWFFSFTCYDSSLFPSYFHSYSHLLMAAQKFKYGYDFLITLPFLQKLV